MIRNNKRKLFIFSIVFAFAFCIVFLAIRSKESYSVMPPSDIFSNINYSYLPESAQEYIYNIYKETGEIILTEKNREDGKPYLNPDYVDYLELIKAGNNQIELIPEALVYDFVADSTNPQQVNIPTSYDLRDVNGVSYVTPIKNQRSLGLCWDFSGIASIESNLLATEVVGTSNPLIFNERTVDYVRAKAIDNIPYNSTNNEPIQVYEEGYNPFMQNGGSNLGSGGGSPYAFKYATYGFALQPMEGNQWGEYFINHPTLSVNDVFNFKTYVVSDYYVYPRLSSYLSDYAVAEFHNTIKSHIMNYGAISLSTITPDGSRGYSCFVSGDNTSDGVPLINNNPDCGSRAPEDKKAKLYHAMNIVGWDDSYEQDYCGLYNIGTTRTDLTEEGCQQAGGTYHTVRGAWIVRNSWGTNYGQNGYLYLAYESRDDSFSGVTKTMVRDFDKFYSFSTVNREDDNYVVNYNRASNSEVLKRVNFEVDSYSGQYSSVKVYLNSQENKVLLGDVNILYKGVYSIDVNDYLLNGDEVSISIENQSGDVKRISNITIFTSVNNDVLIKNAAFDASLKYNSSNIPNITTTILDINLTSNNMSSADKIIFKLFDSSNELVEEFYGYSVLNFFKKKFEISGMLPYGNYTLEASLENGTILYTQSDISLGIPLTVGSFVTFVYNSKEYTGDNSNTTIVVYNANTLEQLVLNEDYTISSLSSDAGTHIVTITGINLYHGTIEKQYTILPKKLDIIIENKIISYGSVLSTSISASDVIVDGVVTGEVAGISGTYTSNYSHSSSAGVYNLSSDNITLVDNGNFKASNYTIDSLNDGYLIVVPIDLSSTINQPLSEIDLPTGFAWMNGSVIVTESGNYKAKALSGDIILASNIDIYVTAIGEPLDYEINNYTVDEVNHYIKDIIVNTDVDTFTSNFTLGYGYGIEVETKTVNDIPLLYTGGKTRITHGLELYMEYTNVIVGDINGDAKINSTDLLRIRQYLLGNRVLSGAYYIASDINRDDKINSTDLLRVRQHLLGTRPIE